MPAYIDAHVHVWTPDTAHYPLAEGYKKEDMKPPSFTPQELFKHSKPAGVDRINLIQMSCLIDPDALPELDRMCKTHPDTPVIIDHLCRIGVNGTIVDKDIEALCAMAKHERVLVKVGAFYALGKKKAPYTDLGPLIQRV